MTRRTGSDGTSVQASATLRRESKDDNSLTQAVVNMTTQDTPPTTWMEISRLLTVPICPWHGNLGVDEQPAQR